MESLNSTITYNCTKCQDHCLDNEDSLCCDNCDEWTHFSCTKITKKHFKHLSSSLAHHAQNTAKIEKTLYSVTVVIDGNTLHVLLSVIKNLNIYHLLIYITTVMNALLLSYLSIV